ncbi:unnamed protein product, partial [Pleuronectes platessa]
MVTSAGRSQRSQTSRRLAATESGTGTKYKIRHLDSTAWDMSKFLNIQCRLSDIRYPQFAKKWINIRKSYGNFYKQPLLTISPSGPRIRPSEHDAEKLGLKYEVALIGLDDSRNISRIALRMLRRLPAARSTSACTPPAAVGPQLGSVEGAPRRTAPAAESTRTVVSTPHM